MGFLHRTHEIIGHEAADLMHFDMLIFLRLHQMEAELLCAAALGGLEDHGSTSRFSASINMRRISRRSEEHTSELQSLMRISYAVFCLKKKINKKNKHNTKTLTRLQTLHTNTTQQH